MTKKEKFISSLKDWKTYVFHIIPFVVIIVSIVVFATSPEQNYSNYALWLTIILYVMTLTKIPNLIDLFKRKTTCATILAAVLIVIYVAFIVFISFCFGDMLKLNVMETECEVLHKEYLQVDPNTVELVQQKHDAWRSALKKMRDVRSSVDLKMLIASLVYLLADIAAYCVDKKDDENEPDEKSTQNNVTVF